MTKLMPDFTDALEQHLRRGAPVSPTGKHAAAPRRRAPRPRLAPLALGCAVLTGTLLTVSAARDDGAKPAYGRPAILKTPVAPNSVEVLERLNSGSVARAFPGGTIRLTEVRSFSAFGGTAYFATGPVAWCLRIPDPDIAQPADPARTGGMTCVPTERAYTYGIWGAIGSNVIAAIPENATPPTLTAPDGTTRTLKPSAQGVVTASAEPGSILKLYGPDGNAEAIQVGGR